MFRVRFYEILDSTNDEVMRLAGKGAGDRTVVVAARQTKGRGRGGRRWCSPEGGLWFSVLLRSQPPAGLNLLGALACAQCVERLCGLESVIQWPNDLYVGRRKLAGILSETRFSGKTFLYACLGVGLNLNLKEQDFPPYLTGQVTSVLMETGRRLNRSVVLREFLTLFFRNYELCTEEGGSLTPVMKEIVRRCNFLGCKVKLELDTGETIVGMAVGLDSSGALELGRGKKVLAARKFMVLE